MTLKYFTAKVSYQPGMATIELDGELTNLAGEALNRAYSETEQHPVEVVRLNFSGVTYLNSAGIALLISLLARARHSQRSIIAAELNAHYLEIFKLSRLAEYMPVFSNEAGVLT